MEIRFDVYFKKNLGTLFKNNEVDLDGIPAHTNLDLNLVDRLEANYKVGTQKYTDSVGIVDIEERVMQIPFKSDVVKVGLNEFEIVAYMRNGDIKASQTYTYNIDKAIGEGVVSGGSGDGHSHTNLAILNSITQSKINEWNNKAEKEHEHDYAEKNHTHNANEIEGLDNIDIDLSSYYTKSETDNFINNKADKENTYTKSQTDNKIVEEIAKAQIGGSGEVDLSAYATKNYVDGKDEVLENEISILNNKVTILEQVDNHKNFKTEFLGELFDEADDNKYLAWSAGNLKFDKTINKYVLLINSADKHNFTTVNKYIVHIDPQTYEISDFYKIEDSLPNLKSEAICNLTLLNNGFYMCIAKIDNINHKIISKDNGKTWEDLGVVNGNTTQHFWAIYKLSNGRLIGSIDSADCGLWYSDDEGSNWTNVNISGNVGDYNAEGCIIELENNKLMCVARKNMSGVGYDSSGYSDKAIISYSIDNGSSWSNWTESKTIDDMNASCCTGVVHDGTVELFVGSRWYKNGSNSNVNYDNTGKMGSIKHYAATIENAINDNFTNLGSIVYSNAEGDGSSQDFHCPCVATNGNDALIVYFDRKELQETKEETNYHFIRCTLDNFRYKNINKAGSRVFGYTGYYIDKMLKKQYLELSDKINEIILSGGGSVDAGDSENPQYFISEGCEMFYDFMDLSTHDTQNMTIEDKINKVKGIFTTTSNGQTKVSEFPSIEENFINESYFTIPAGSFGEMLDAETREFSIEFVHYTDTVEDNVARRLLTFNGGGGSSLRLAYNFLTIWFNNSTSSNNTTGFSIEQSGYNSYSITNNPGLHHLCATFSSNGLVEFYYNGVKRAETTPTDFVKWADRLLTNSFCLEYKHRRFRAYNRVLSSDEILHNYNYECKLI